MLTHEYDFLRREESRSAVHWVVVAAVALLCAVIPLPFVLLGDGVAAHLAGRTESVMAEVTAVEQIGKCKSTQKYAIDVTWTDDGVAEQGTYEKCRDAPPIGTTVQLWIGPDSKIHSTSPRGDRIGLIALSGGLGLLAAGCGTAVVILRAGQRRRLLSVAGLALIPVGQIDARTVRNADLVLRPASPGALPGPTGARVVLYSRPGKRPVKHGRHRARGAWWLHLTPPHSTPKKRIGLLVRGSERCWIEIRAR